MLSKLVAFWRRARLFVIFAIVTTSFTATFADPQGPGGWDPPRPQYCAPRNDCALPTIDPFGKEQVTVLAYGGNAADKPGWQMHLSSGIPVRKCAYSGGRQDETPDCTVYGYDMPKVTRWNHCANDTGLCRISGLGPNQYRIVRFGLNNVWVYAFVASDINCVHYDFSGVSYDPLPNVAKVCQVSNETFTSPTSDAWTRCATGGIQAANKCLFEGDGTHIVRLLKPHDPNYRVVYRLVSGASYQCWESNFYVSATFVHSRNSNQSLYDNAERNMQGTVCEYLRLSDIQAVFGNWELVGMCDNCGDSVQYTVSTGIEKGRSVEKSTTFGREISSVFRAGHEGTMFGTETSVTFSFEQSETIAESFSHSEGADFTIGCDKGALYQWVTGVRLYCAPTGGDFKASECQSIAKSNMFRCVAPGDHPGLLPVVIGRPKPNT